MNFTVRTLAGDELSPARRLSQIWREDNGLTASPPDNEYILRLLKRPDSHAIVALHDDKVLGGLTA